jgi:RHS repeat-associated protein
MEASPVWEFALGGLGSTTAITDFKGGAQKTYQYDVYGGVRAQTGTTPNEFTYTGEQVDSSGLEYLRARYYDSATGRFLSSDPLAVQPGWTGHRFAYVDGNPVNLTDPLGLCGVCDFVSDKGG